MKTFILLVVFYGSISFAQNSEISYYTSIAIESHVYDEPRNIWVGLPENYDSSRTYSTIYVLDAETRFDITYALTREYFQNQSELPELIVVGIPQIDWPHRKMDMTFTDSKLNSLGEIDTTKEFGVETTGGGFDFLKHIEDEVVEYVDSNYATNGFNTLVGHSLGGYFCAYILPIQKRFSAFQIYDPSIWYNEGDVLKHLEKSLQDSFKSNVFLSSALYFDGPRKYVDNHLNQIENFHNFLESFDNINLDFIKYEKEDHVSMYMFSVMDGFTVLFKDCEYGFINPYDEISLQSYRNYYRSASERIGFELSPPLDGIRWVAYANFYQKNWELAIEAYLACYAKFENDVFVNDELATCYENLGDNEKSLYYKNKVELLKKKN